MKTKVAVVCIVALLLAGCDLLGLAPNPLVGVWQTNLFGTVTYEFKSNGEFVETIELGFSDPETIHGTWTSDSTKITLTYNSQTESVLYSFNSDKSTLTLTPVGGGLSVTFVRK